MGVKQGLACVLRSMLLCLAALGSNRIISAIIAFKCILVLWQDISMMYFSRQSSTVDLICQQYFCTCIAAPATKREHDSVLDESYAGVTDLVEYPPKAFLWDK